MIESARDPLRFCYMSRESSFSVAISVSVSALLLVAVGLSVSAQDDSESPMNKLTPKERRNVDRAVGQEEANVLLAREMDKVAGWLDQYCVWNHHFPEEGDEFEDAKRQLNMLIPNNPYKYGATELPQGRDLDPTYDTLENIPSPFTFAAGSFAADGDRIKLEIDPGLNLAAIPEWKKNPPMEWSAPPGTVTCISNNNDVFIVWAAGMDGRPIREPYSRQIRLVQGNYNLLY